MIPYRAFRSRTWPNRANTWSCIFIYGLAAIYTFGQMSQAPMLPYIWRQLEGSDMGFGLWFVEFCTLQLIGNLCSGPFIDWVGARAWFAVSNAAAAAMFGITAIAWNFWMLYASRLPALLELGVLSSRALIAERTDETDRAVMLGYLGMALGIGSTIGSVVGGQLSEISLQFCAWFAMFTALPCILLSLMIPPAAQEDGSADEELELAHRQPSQELKEGAISRLRKDSSRSSSGPLKLASSFAFSTVSWTIGFVMDRHYHLQPKDAGYVMSYVGIVSIISQGALVGPVSRAMPCRKVVLLFGWALVASYVCMALSAHSVWLFLGTLTPIWTCGGVMDTILTSQLTRAVPEDGKATVLSADAAISGLAGAVAPFIGTSLFHVVGYRVFSVGAAALLILMLSLVHANTLVC